MFAVCGWLTPWCSPDVADSVCVCVVFRKTRSWVVDPSVFTCISMLARAMGPEMTANVKELLESMFATGLR